MKKSREKIELDFRPRVTETVSIDIPKDTYHKLATKLKAVHRRIPNATWVLSS